MTLYLRFACNSRVNVTGIWRYTWDSPAIQGLTWQVYVISYCDKYFTLCLYQLWVQKIFDVTTKTDNSGNRKTSVMHIFTTQINCYWIEVYEILLVIIRATISKSYKSDQNSAKSMAKIVVKRSGYCTHHRK